MTSRCVKCNRDSEVGSLLTKGGTAFFVCDKCPVESISSADVNKKENWFLKNIREAKERRASGQNLWPSQERKTDL